MHNTTGDSTPSHLYMCKHISVAIQDNEKLTSLSGKEWIEKHGFVQIYHVASDTSLAPSSLSDIHQFCEMVDATEKVHKGSRLLLLPGPVRSAQISSIYLVGCHAILSGQPCQEVFSIFEDCLDLLVSLKYSGDLTVLDFWRAISQTRELHWIGEIGDDDEEHGGVNMDEYAHYVRCADRENSMRLPVPMFCYVNRSA